MVPGVRHPEYVIQLWSNCPRLQYSCSPREQPLLQDFTRHRFFGWISTSKIRPVRAPIPCFSGPGGNNSLKNGNNSGYLEGFSVGDREVTNSNVIAAKTDMDRVFACSREFHRLQGHGGVLIRGCDFTTENGGGQDPEYGIGAQFWPGFVRV